MSYTLKTDLANKANYGRQRNTNKIKYLVFHATSNDGDTDESNARYFRTHVVKASAHAFIDDNSVTVSVPANYVAYAVGGKRYSDYNRTGGASMYGKITNTNSYNIEMCDCNKNGKYNFTEKTLENAVSYGKYIMNLYNIPITNVYMHFDVNGKHCPIQWWNKLEEWNKFKQRLRNTNVSTTVAQEMLYTKTQFIKDVQKAIGAGVDGKAGRETLSKTVTVSSITNRRHAVVKPIQKYLNSKGFNCGTIDGCAGAKFDAAVKAYQRANGCITDGVITAKGKTWKKLLGLA